MIRQQDGVALAHYARAAIAAALGGPTPPPPSFPGADELASTFVTLRRGGALHGCIGTLEPRRSLIDDVRSNAVSAALFDPRATPLRAGDADALSIEVSLLGPLERIACASERDAIAAIRPGDGLVLRAAGRRGTFLPQVWESIPEPAMFLASLKRKASIRAWTPDVELYRYGVTKFCVD
jgi:AmmeMemoRadiSam system protein A